MTDGEKCQKCGETCLMYIPFVYLSRVLCTLKSYTGTWGRFGVTGWPGLPGHGETLSEKRTGGEWDYKPVTACGPVTYMSID